MEEKIFSKVTDEKDSSRRIKTKKYLSLLISNCPESISVSQMRVNPTKQDEINGVLEISMPTNIAKDRIYWKYLS